MPHDPGGICYDQRSMGNVLDDPCFGAVLFVFRDFKANRTLARYG